MKYKNYLICTDDPIFIGSRGELLQAPPSSSRPGMTSHRGRSLAGLGSSTSSFRALGWVRVLEPARESRQAPDNKNNSGRMSTPNPTNLAPIRGRSKSDMNSRVRDIHGARNTCGDHSSCGGHDIGRDRCIYGFCDDRL